MVQNYFFQQPDYKPTELKELGIWAKENIEEVEKETIMARKPDVSFYAGAVWELIPAVKDIEELKNLMRLKNIKYIVMDDRSLGGDWQDVKFLLDPINNPKGFNKLKELEYFEHRAVIYKLENEK